MRTAEKVLVFTLRNAGVASTAKICGDSNGGGNMRVLSFSSYVDVIRDQNRSCVETYTVDSNSENNCLRYVARVAKESNKAEVFSPDKKVYATHSVTELSGEKTDFVELWSVDEGCLEAINVSKQKKHGKVISGGQFSGLGGSSISNDNSKLVYIAEMKHPEKHTYFLKEPDDGVNEFLTRDTWGDQLTEATTTQVCVADFESQTVSVLDHLSDSYSYTSPVWLSEDRVAVIGYVAKPFKLGLLYCNNRETKVFVTSLTSKEVWEVSKMFQNKCFSYVFPSVDGKYLIALMNDTFGAHMQLKAIIKIDLTTFEGEILETLSLESVPSHPWITDDTFCVNVFQGALIKPMFINVSTKSATPLSYSISKLNGSLKFLDCHKGLILVANSSFVTSERLMIFKKDEDSFIDCSLPRKMSIDCFFKATEFPDWGYYFIGPKDQSYKHPCLLFVHGGPHVLSVNYFDKVVVFFVQMDFNMVVVNYRGSLGYTNESLQSLPGNVGSSDVEDCFSALQQGLSCREWNCDTSRVAVLGGSHGGFLSLHLIGQYPDTFKACSVRNPVTNIGSMMAQSDIPDWALFECTTGVFQFDQLSDPDFYDKAWKMSPISHVRKVNTPTQIHLGVKDKRVPPSQGREYHRALKGIGKAETVLFEYPEDCHPLSSPKATASVFLESYQWFCKHLDINPL